MKDLPLNTTTHDLDIYARPIEGRDQVRQSLKIRLLFFLGEWFLDLFAGVPYYQDVLKKQARGLSRVEAVFKNAITETPGVLSLDSFAHQYDPGARIYNFQFVATSIYGELRGTITLSTAVAQLPLVIITDNIVIHGA